MSNPKIDENIIIDENHLLEFLKKNDQDFIFELKVLEKINSLKNKLKIETTYGGSYIDPVTKKTRQYDIRAEIELLGNRIKLAIECKNLRKYNPLLIYLLKRKKNECYHNMISSPPGINGIIIENILSNYTYYHEGSEVGKNLIQVGKSINEVKKNNKVGKNKTQVRKSINEFISGDSDIFEKWSQSISSAYDLINIPFKENKTFVIPILVVPDDTLWGARYDDNGELINKPEKLDKCEYFIGKNYQINFIGNSIGYYSISHLHIYTFSGLERFLSKFENSNNLNNDFVTDLFNKQNYQKKKVN